MRVSSRRTSVARSHSASGGGGRRAAVVGAHGGRAQPGVEPLCCHDARRYPAAPRGVSSPGAWASSSTSARRTGSTGSSRSATTAGSTRCSGRRRCARRRSRPPASTRRGLEVLDAGAGTGFTTEGIVERVDPARVTMLDQSPHQLARARRKPALAACRKLLGDAERLPFEDASFDRYVSAGSIEYWPDPQRGIAEAHRVLREGGTGVVIGPVEPANPILRRLAEHLDAVPAGGRLPRLVRARRLRGRRRSTRSRPTGTAAAPSTPSPSAAPSAGPTPRRCRAGRRPRSRDAPLTLAGRARFAGALRARLRRRPRVRADRRRARAARPAGAALMAVAGAVAAPARAATVLWRFSRPHTMIGTAVSVVGLFAIVARRDRRRRRRHAPRSTCSGRWSPACR